MRHKNPYRINDPDDIFEVGENSSHPELTDATRIWKFGGYSFKSATEIQKFFASEGLNYRNFVMEPTIERDLGGKHKITINIVEKWKSRNHRRLRELSFNGI